MRCFGRFRENTRVAALLFAFFIPGCNALIDPPVPRNLTATSESPREITLTWAIYLYDEDPGDIGYKIFRNGEYVDYTLGSSYMLTTWYEDSGLAPDREYCYRVSSFYITDVFDFTSFLLDWQNDSAQSDEICVWTYPLSAVTGRVTADDIGLEGIEIVLFKALPTGNALSVFTDLDGFYIFPDLDNGIYLVAPSDPGFVFTPESIKVSVFNGDATGLDFHARAAGGLQDR
jgi:hypothetical protein